MASGHVGSVHTEDRSTNWLTTAASLIAGSAFMALWFWLLPSWLGFQVNLSGMSWRWIAALPSALGFAVALRCVWDFGRTGHGTPVPIAPPKRLVVVGFYRYVRNPMYVGFYAGWTGLWILFGRANWSAIAVAIAVVIAVDLFVRFYEEPTLHRLFGADYDEYRHHVGRWIPRLHAWQK